MTYENFEKVLPVQVGLNEIERRAITIAKQFDFDHESDTIYELAERVGGRVTVLAVPRIDQLNGGSLIVHGLDNDPVFEIFLSPTTGMLRDNFTVAHELGHYFLHSGDPSGSKRISVGRYGSDLCEQQANRFAAALLMPLHPFKEAAQGTRNNINILAGLFRVSPAAVEARIRSLGLDN